MCHKSSLSGFQDRASGGISEQKKQFAHEHEHIGDFESAVKSIKPTAIIGMLLGYPSLS